MASNMMFVPQIALDNLREVNDQLSADIAELRNQISALKTSNTMLGAQLVSLQSAHFNEIAELYNQISGLKASNALFETHLISSQSAQLNDIAEICNQVSALNASNIFLLSQLDCLESAHYQNTKELCSQISALKASNTLLESSLVSLHSAHCRLVDRANNAEMKHLLTRKYMFVMWREGEILKLEFQEEKDRLMAKIETLECKVSEFLEENAMMGTQLVKYEEEKGLVHAKMERKIENTERYESETKQFVNAENNKLYIQANFVGLKNIFVEIEGEKQSKREESNKSRKITFWAVLSSAVAAVVASIFANVICRR